MTLRRQWNQTIFRRIGMDDDGVTKVELHPFFAAMLAQTTVLHYTRASFQPYDLHGGNGVRRRNGSGQPRKRWPRTRLDVFLSASVRT